ncbi:MAG: hypothetical protein KF845_15650 [Cyclobacteriaceae bacterium]|nr:hypothetical protein [Cyclobacteriaceae bacterium]
MKTPKIYWISVFVMVSFFTACEKEDVACTDEKAFCNLVNKQEFNATGQVIDNFLESLQKNDDLALEKLKEWLECKSCVKTAEILCNSCIETLPLQSEILVKFNANGQVVEKTMDISMSDKLKFEGYH